MVLPEICESIIHHLREDQQSLKACSLVSYNWRYISQKQIFRRIVFESSSSAKKFQFLLQTAPHVAPYVRDICIANHYNGWFSRHSSLLSILPLLSNINSLVLRGSHCHWSSIDPKVQKAFVSVLLSEKLVSLSIEDWETFPLSLINHCQALQHLGLVLIKYPVNDDQYSNIPPNLSDVHAQLQSLRVCLLQTPALNHTLDLIGDRILQLKDLEVRGENYDWIGWLLQRCSNSLEHFTLHPISPGGLEPDSTKFPIDLGPLNRLRTVQFHFYVFDMDDSRNWTGLPWLLELLRNVTPDNQIEEIAFNSTLLYFEDTSFDFRTWKDIDKLLANSGVMKHLRSVQLCERSPADREVARYHFLIKHYSIELRKRGLFNIIDGTHAHYPCSTRV